MRVPLEVARFKFPYPEAAEVAIGYRDDANQVVLHAAKDAYDYLQIMIRNYEDLLQERDILAEENRIMREML